jgi:hypothetical protein
MEQDAWLLPEVDTQGTHSYLAREMETFPLQLTPWKKTLRLSTPSPVTHSATV